MEILFIPISVFKKIQEAALILIKTDTSILEIAGYFGYDNRSKFTKAFKDIMGMTPNEFRKVNKALI